MIRIRLLGPFEATRQDGTSVRPPGRRSLCLLACLAQAEAPRWQRHELAALLWHGRAPEQARGSLRQELVRLRRAFGPLLDDCRSGDQQLMPVLAPDRVEVDLDRFRAAAGDPMRAMQAVALYRGEFLQDVVVQAGDPFAAWLENNQRAIHKMAVACLRHLLCSGEASESIARRLIDLVPNSEEAHIWLLRHSAERGDGPGFRALSLVRGSDAQRRA